MILFKLRHAWYKLTCECNRSHVYDLGAGLELHVCEQCHRCSYWLSMREEQRIDWARGSSWLGREWKWDPILDVVKLKVGAD